MRLLLSALIAYSAVVTAVSVPACVQNASAPEVTLDQVRTANISLPYPPFGVIYASKQKDRAFVALSQLSDGTHGFYSSTIGVIDTANFTPSLLYQIPLPDDYEHANGALGIALTHDGRHLLLAADVGAIVVDAALAAEGCADAVVGYLNGTMNGTSPGNAATEVTLSPDDEYAFISQEFGITPGVTSGNVDVIKINKAGPNGSVSGMPVGELSLGREVVGTAISPDSKYLYATSEMVSTTQGQGSVSVIDLATLETDPANALLSTVPSGCGAVRVIVSSGGETVWVTARESNRLLAYDAATMLSDPENALLASVQVGTSPVGLVFARNESRIITADSDRFNYANATTGLSVVDVEAALAGKQAVLGRIPTGLFPRELAVSPDGKVLLVSDHDSNQLQAVDITSLP